MFIVNFRWHGSETIKCDFQIHADANKPSLLLTSRNSVVTRQWLFKTPHTVAHCCIMEAPILKKKKTWKVNRNFKFSSF